MQLQSTFGEILELQSYWTSGNTTEMQRRGDLVRNNGPTFLREISPRLRNILGPAGSDFIVEGRDGTGRKTEIPWIRLASKSRSPGAQDGWYCVFLFHAKGDGFYLSLMHGSTRFVNGEYVPRSDEELREHVMWARSLLASELTNDQETTPDMDLGTSRKLGRAYEKSSAVATWHARDAVPSDDEMAGELEFFMSLLRKVYDAMDLGRSPGGVAPEVVASEAAIERALRPATRGSRQKGQGFGLNFEERRLVELHAMTMAQKLLNAEGFDLKDVSGTHPYDFIASKDGEELIVEIKGTTANLGSIVLTANEVEAHRSHHPRNILIIVHSVELDRSLSDPLVSGGDIVKMQPWWPIEKNLKPLSFKYVVEEQASNGLPV